MRARGKIIVRDQGSYLQGKAGTGEVLNTVSVLGPATDGEASLIATLVQVAELAVQAVPGADGAGVTLMQQDRPDAMVATATFVAEVDAVQYRLGQGPCITAASTGRTIRVDSLGGDKRWPRFGSAVARMNVHSSLSLPLVTPEGVVGSMNIYAHAKRSFDDRSTELGEAFSVSAAVAVQNARLIAQSQRLAEQLQEALVSRAGIDQAIGILMSRSGSSADEAFARLRTLSQSEHQKLSVVAAALVDEAVRRARSRTGGAGLPTPDSTRS
jgi:GAF domain-containing protein